MVSESFESELCIFKGADWVLPAAILAGHTAASRPGRPHLPDGDVLWRYLHRHTFDGNRCCITESTPISENQN